MPEHTVILDGAASHRALTRIAHEIAERNRSAVLIGIQRGGIILAQRLAVSLTAIWGQPVLVGSLDITMHRDDVGQAIPPVIHPTVIPFNVTGQTVVLVDDVIFSGRTTRAALDALNDFGRAKRIQLAVLVDRGAAVALHHRALGVDGRGGEQCGKRGGKREGQAGGGQNAGFHREEMVDRGWRRRGG